MGFVCYVEARRSVYTEGIGRPWLLRPWEPRAEFAEHCRDMSTFIYIYNAKPPALPRPPNPRYHGSVRLINSSSQPINHSTFLQSRKHRAFTCSQPPFNGKYRHRIGTLCVLYQSNCEAVDHTCKMRQTWPVEAASLDRVRRLSKRVG